MWLVSSARIDRVNAIASPTDQSGWRSLAAPSSSSVSRAADTEADLTNRSKVSSSADFRAKASSPVASGSHAGSTSMLPGGPVTSDWAVESASWSMLQIWNTPPRPLAKAMSPFCACSAPDVVVDAVAATRNAAAATDGARGMKAPRYGALTAVVKQGQPL